MIRPWWSSRRHLISRNIRSVLSSAASIWETEVEFLRQFLSFLLEIRIQQISQIPFVFEIHNLTNVSWSGFGVETILISSKSFNGAPNLDSRWKLSITIHNSLKYIFIHERIMDEIIIIYMHICINIWQPCYLNNAFGCQETGLTLNPFDQQRFPSPPKKATH